MSEPDSISKTRRKKAMLDLQALGEALITLKPAELERLDLPDNLREASAEARRITQHGALKRQRQYIGRLMREVDAQPIRAALDAWNGQSRAAVAAQHQAERWRDRLIADEQELAAFAEAFRDADLGHFRTLARSARQERAENRPPRAARQLYRDIHRLLAERIDEQSAPDDMEDEPHDD